jgi:hypothetical protein
VNFSEVQRTNPHRRNVFGYSEREVLGRNVLDVDAVAPYRDEHDGYPASVAIGRGLDEAPGELPVWSTLSL